MPTTMIIILKSVFATLSLLLFAGCVQGAVDIIRNINNDTL